jgi:hypothetical protein
MLLQADVPVRFCQPLQVVQEIGCAVLPWPYETYVLAQCVRAYLEGCSRLHSQGPAPNFLLRQLQTKQLPVQAQKPKIYTTCCLQLDCTRFRVHYGQAAKIMPRAASGRG